jgi:BirA family transcriptional regulator, biotin operon repressor / biotin---[acetyl-CoA-carboxylase] ligase
MIISTPEILNDLARAGASGIELTSIAERQSEIDTCREWRFPLVTTPDGRAVLENDPDSLIPALIDAEATERVGHRVAASCFLRLGSTNDEAAARARSGAPQRTVICAEQQTAGRGRKGRRWNSPPRAGLYFSLVVRPAQSLYRWPILTHVAAIALFETLMCTAVPSDTELDLKWPNDLMLNGRKCAGILLESAGAPGLPAAIIGVGVNVRHESVPRELLQTATSIEAECGSAVPRRPILVSFLDQFERVYRLFEDGRHGAILDLWKERSSMWNGAEVTVIDGSSSRVGVTCGLTAEGALRVMMAGGSEETILSGDVTVRRGAGR